MICETARVDQALERARGALLLGYEACRRAHDSAGLDQEVVVVGHRTLDELVDIIRDIRDLLGPRPGRGGGRGAGG